MASLEKKKGKETIVLPDFIKIHDPKEDHVPNQPEVQFPQRREQQ